MTIQPTDLVTLREFSRQRGLSLSTVRTWVHRYATDPKWPHQFPAPWRKGATGEPDLYLLADLDNWLVRTKRA